MRNWTEEEIEPAKKMRELPLFERSRLIKKAENVLDFRRQFSKLQMRNATKRIARKAAGGDAA